MPLLVVFLPKAFNDYFNYRLAFVGIYFIAIIGLNVLTGYNGQISLGHGAFMAIGAYTTAILNVNYGVGIYWTIPIAGHPHRPVRLRVRVPGAPAVGRLPGARHLRPRGLDPAVAKRFEGFTGGGQGKTVPLPSSPIGGPDDERMALLPDLGDCRGDVRARLVPAARPRRGAPSGRCATRRSPRSRPGSASPGTRRSRSGSPPPTPASPARCSRSAIAFVNPDTFPVSLSILLLTGAVVGGLGSLGGMLFGAFFIQFAPGWGERSRQARPLQRGDDAVDRLLRADPARRALRDAGRRRTTSSPTGNRLETSKAVDVQSRGLTRGSVTSRRRNREEQSSTRPRRRRYRSGDHDGCFGGRRRDTWRHREVVVIGGTFPFTGPASSYAPIPVGMQAYFSYVNALRTKGKRGVFGRQIVFKAVDDGYNPAQTVQKTKAARRAGQGVRARRRARHRAAGGGHAYLNQQKVPQIYVSTGATEWGARDKHASHPYTIGWQPDYQAEGAIYGRYIVANLPNAKIGIIYQNDSYGRDYINGLRPASARTRARSSASRASRSPTPR